MARDNSLLDDDDDDDDYRDRRRGRRRYDPPRDTLILVLGIVSVTVFPLASIAAWIMGGRDLKEMRAGRMDPSGESKYENWLHSRHHWHNPVRIGNRPSFMCAGLFRCASASVRIARIR